MSHPAAAKSSHARRPLRGFSFVEVLVVVGIIALLLGILIPTASAVRRRSYIDRCADNLRQIGLATAMYEQQNHGALPRTAYDAATANVPVFGTADPAWRNPFVAGAGAPRTNDVTAAIFLLRQTQGMPPELFICPYNDVSAFEPDPVVDPAQRSDFVDWRKNLAYSFANPYPTPAAAAGYTPAKVAAPTFPLAADINPGTKGLHDNVLVPSVDSPDDVQRLANSANHEKDGQNVLFGDGHVDWSDTAFCGIDHDNIYAAQTQPARVAAGPATPGDSVLLPSDDEAPPANP